MMDNHKKLCTICCRGGSKGIKNKNIRPLLGKPLLAYTIEQAKESRIFNHIILSTDSQEIAEVGKYYGADVFFLRDPQLATDKSGKLCVIQDALLRSEKYYKEKFDFICDLDATSPLRDTQDIVQAYMQFIQNKNEILITASPSRKNPYFNLIEIFNENGEEYVELAKKPDIPILCRQDAPKCFDMNASIYIWTREALLSSKRLFGKNIGLYVMPENKSIDIDTELDFEFVEFLLNKKGGKNANQ